MAKWDAIIIGGGLSGLAAAVRLTQRGRKVLLLEARPVLGGRTSSWNEHGMVVESGLHRYLGFYKALPALWKSVGLRLNDVIIWEDEMEVRLPDGQPNAVFHVSVRRPLRTLLSVIGNTQFLSFAEKRRLGRLIASGMLGAIATPHEMDKEDIVTYARRHGLPDALISKMITPFSTGLFFLPPKDYSAYAFFAPFLPAALRFPRLGVGAFRGGMTEVMANPIAQWLTDHGATIATHAKVEGLVFRGAIRGVRLGGKTVTGNNVIVATTLGAAKKLIDSAFPAHPWFASMRALATMPVVTAQFELDQPAMPVDHTTFAPGTRLACFSEQSRTTFRNLPGRFSVIMAEPRELIDATPERVARLVYDEAERLQIALAPHVTDFRVIYQPDDFYHLGPGNDALRPPQKTPINGLTLAGDYTQQPLLGSMEGAVLAGNHAADRVLRAA